VSIGSCEFFVESVLVINGHLEEVASAIVFLKSNNDRTLNTAHINNLPASANIVQNCSRHESPGAAGLPGGQA
jgi:hypothetical protein